MTQHTLDPPITASGAGSDLPLPPLVPGRWPFGHMRALLEDPLRAYQALREHGDIVRFRAGTHTMTLVARPDAVQQILQRNATNYDKRAPVYERLKPLLGEGIATSNGEPWLSMRRTALPAFQRRQIDAVVPASVRAAEEVACRWQQADRAGEPVDLRADSGRIALRVTSELLLGLDMAAEAERLGEALTPVLQELHRRLYTPLLPPSWLPTAGNQRLTRAIRDLDRIVLEIIEHARRSPRTDRLIDRLIAQASEGEGDPLVRLKHLRDEVTTYLLAGYETTANAIAYTFMCLGQRPGVLARMQAELDRVLAGRRPGPSDLERLRYTRMVLEESLRLLPPIWTFDRRASGDDVLAGYRLPKGSIVVISPWLLHRDPGLWPAPTRFRPERFEDAETAHRHPFAYLPFAGGPRGCLGQRFALTEALTVLAVLGARYRPGRIFTPLKLEPSITLRPAGPLLVRMQARPPREVESREREDLVHELFVLLTPALRARERAERMPEMERLALPGPDGTDGVPAAALDLIESDA